MTVRINNNIAALRTAHTMSEVDRKLAESLEKLSSGFRINRGADNPSGLVISEQMRGQISGINQAISNTELATAMLQTAEGSITEVNNILIRIRERALHAANEGGNDRQSVEADEIEVKAGIEAIGRIATSTSFGKRNLLDGSSGIIGEAQGQGLVFLSATQRTHTSPIAGYSVEVTQLLSRAVLEGRSRVDADEVRDLTVSLIEGGKSVRISGDRHDSPDSFVGRLRYAVDQAGLRLDVLFNDGRLTIRHKDYGSQPTFQAISSIDGVLSRDAGAIERPEPGTDIAGTIGGESARGSGLVLRGQTGNENTDGLSVRYTGPYVRTGDRTEEGEAIREYQPTTGNVGTVNVANNALDFQIGPNVGQRIGIALPALSPQFLARKVDTETGFSSLQDVRVTTPATARDTLKLVDSAIDEITEMRGRLGAIQKDGLESNLNTLRVTAENLLAAESTIRDTDIAKELAEYTRNRILFDANVALLAQANQQSTSVINLIR
ncbi:MAG TPA: flagellin [bacterium]